MVTDEDHDGEGSTLENGDEEMESDQWQLETETDQCNKISCPGLKTAPRFAKDSWAGIYALFDMLLESIRLERLNNDLSRDTF